MKKLAVLLLTTLSAICLAVSIPRFSARAETGDNKTVPTATFLPSSALQLYDLKSPISINYSNSGYMVIAEHIGGTDGTSLFDRISVYDPTTQKFGALSPHPTIYNVTHAEEYSGYVFYLSNSRLYSVPTTNLSEEPFETPITSSNFFQIKGNYLITNTNNSIVIYEVSTQGGLTFTKKSTHNFTTKNAFISEENNVYYLFGGKLYCFDTQSSTSYEVATVSVDVNYMAELGGYIYLSSSTGIYRVQKSANSQVEQIISSNNVQKLGNISNPQGLAVMEGDLLIADPTLKCVQAINPQTNEFTDFAITTESTADYRLTNNASSLSLSENYAYVLDDGEAKEDGTVYKRIVKVSIDKNAEKRYQSFSLEPLYEQNSNLNIKLITCSNSHIAIYADKTLSLYNVLEGTLKKEYSIESESVTSLFYLDGEFYYTDYALHNFEHNKVVVHKITLPSQDNELSEIKNAKLNENALIKGVCKNMAVDVFGGVYMLVDPQDGESSKLIKLKNGVATTLAEIDYLVKTIKVDFASNLYVLSESNVLYKYGYEDYANYQTFKFDTDLPIKDIDLNYRSNKCYALSNSCILQNSNDALEIINLSAISAKNLQTSQITSPKFITASNDAKLFKITLNDYDENLNFKSVTPITNPTPDKVYLVVAEIENYYIVSHSNKLVALISKTDTEYSQTEVFDSAIIPPTYYSDFDIEIENLQGAERYISSSTIVFSKPIFDHAYETQTLSKGEKVKAVQKVTFNGTSLTLISDLSGNLKGYVVSGYLLSSMQDEVVTSTQKIDVVTSNGSRHFNNTLMILVIALTVTLVALFIEKKLLFDKEDHNVNK